ncbi:unnamed protein product [Euphydryas editha]|uniref:PHD-type domain-containing protein n=1 Tax=Euphydryas editha TaxID=104508 RepID=A0AAU9TKE9_EUPED|nr:unnamed protein product [Euphydryas editha]
MAESKKCDACLKQLSDIPSMDCSRCMASYHHFCVNISLPDLNDMSVESKSKWICVQCLSRERKGGDNSNTPVRNCKTSTLMSPTMGTIVHPEMVEFRNAISSFESSMTYFNTELEKVKSEHNEQLEIIRVLKTEIESLKSSNRTLSSRLAQIDQHARSSNLEIHCVPENKQENLINTVVQLGKVIKCPISEAQIHYCSRLAKMNSTSPRPRSILVKFNSPRLRDEFLAATIKFNRNNRDDKLNASHLGIGGTKRSAIYVAEHLTRENKSLHAATRSRARELGYKYVWVRDSRIFVRKNEQSNFIHINNIDALNKLS